MTKNRAIYVIQTNQISGKPAQPVVKRKSLETKVMICVWWDNEGVLHFELAPEGWKMKPCLTFILSRMTILLVDLNSLFIMWNGRRPLGRTINQTINHPHWHCRLWRMFFEILGIYVIQQSGKSSRNLFSSVNIVFS